MSKPPRPAEQKRDLSHLDETQYKVTQKGATEAPFSGEHLHNKENGKYRCVVCEKALFRSDSKYDSGSGWPSFMEPTDPGHVDHEFDDSHGMRRVEVRCSDCGAHLGHVFDDGPGADGQRYCINSAALAFAPQPDADDEDEQD